MERTVTLGEIEDRSISDLLHDVARQHTALRVVLDTGETVSVEAAGPSTAVTEAQPPLKPLLVLDGFVPEGWKDAIYDYSE